MPEGDTIFRVAARIRPLVERQTILAARGHERWCDASTLPGQQIAQVEARGKHLLIHLSDRRAIHSHLGMTGSWHIYGDNQPWHKPQHHAALVLFVPAAACVLFYPKTLEILSPDRLRRHEHLNRLGPDILTPEFDAQEVLRRLRIHNATPIGEAIMNQTIVAGIGNIYKSETLFVIKANPFQSTANFADEALIELIKTARQLMRSNVSPLSTRSRKTRIGRAGGNYWVYGRAGEPCYTCGEKIQVRRQGDQGRTTFYCGGCQ